MGEDMQKVLQSTIIVDTFAILLCVFTIGYSYTIYKEVLMASTSSDFGTLLNLFTFVSLQAVFLSVLLYGGYYVLRRSGRRKGRNEIRIHPSTNGEGS
jgi:hypothetical protein